MSVIPRCFEGPKPCPRYVMGCDCCKCYPPPRRPCFRCTQRYWSSPSNAPRECCCCYDLPCKAHCFNHGACTRASGRYARTVWYPGEWPPKVPPCQAFLQPNPPFHPCCAYTCNKII